MPTMTAIWDETVAFMRRESGILLPLWLSTLVIGDAGSRLALQAIQGAGAAGSGGATLGLFAAGLVSAVGQLAVTALVLRKGISVGEALSLAVSRLPKLLIFGVLSLVGALIALVPAVMLLIGSGVDLTSAQPNLPGWAALYFLGFAAFAIWFGIRMITFTPHIVDRNPPLLVAVRDSFSRTKGRVAPILGVGALYMLIAIIVGGVARILFGSLGTVLGSATGLVAVAHVAEALLIGALGGGLTMVATLFIAHLYRAMSTGSSSGT